MPQCLKCQYDLRGSDVEGNCPECGYPVALSLRGVHPHDRLRSIALKVSAPFVTAYSICCFTTMLGAAVGEPFYRHVDWSHMLRYVIIPTAALVLWAGWAVTVSVLVWHRVLGLRWIALIIWSIIASLFLAMGMERYVRDLIEVGSWEPVPP